MALKELFEAGHLLNLTPHPLTLFRGEGEAETLPSHGSVRLEEKVQEVPNWPLPLVRKWFEGLTVALEPIPADIRQYAAANLNGGGADGHILMVAVSGIVAEALRDNSLRYEFAQHLGDLLGVEPEVSGRDLDPHLVVIVPDTGPESVVRDADGRIIGVRRFYTVR